MKINEIKYFFTNAIGKNTQNEKSSESVRELIKEIIDSEKDNKISDQKIADILENKGIKIASGEIIGFLHADDFYASPTIIEEVMMKFETTNADSVYGDLQYVSKKNPEKMIRNWNAGEFSFKKLLNGWMPPHPSFFVKRKSCC